MPNSSGRWSSKIGLAGLIVWSLALATHGLGNTAAEAQAPTADQHVVKSSWDIILPAAQRFEVLAAFGSEAVKDNETGLVWEKAPETVSRDWNRARFDCVNKTVGGRKGWRLPTVFELGSLIDPSIAPPSPVLPNGHPFTGISAAAYWSASTNEIHPNTAWFVTLKNGGVGSHTKSNNGHVWCVRGDMHTSHY